MEVALKGLAAGPSVWHEANAGGKDNPGFGIGMAWETGCVTIRELSYLSLMVEKRNVAGQSPGDPGYLRPVGN